MTDSPKNSRANSGPDDVQPRGEASDGAGQAAETNASGGPAVHDEGVTGGGDDSSAAAEHGDEPERLYTEVDVAALRRELRAEAEDQRLRLLAEYQNFRRRTARERERWTAEALEPFVKDLLPVFDSFDKARAIRTGDAAAVAEGLDVTYKLLRTALDKHDVEVIDPLGETFDPQWHEALMRRSSDEHESGTVVEVFECGYRIGDVLVRPARTIVAGE